MDCRELIKILRNQEDRVILQYVEDAADAIETLLAEREALMAQIHGQCGLCINRRKCIFDYGARRDCVNSKRGNWKWSGFLLDHDPEN